jgi:HK97 family phage prohead protease
MRETRFAPSAGLRVEARAMGDDAPPRPRIVGHASVFDQWTTLYEGKYWTWREVVRPGAYAACIKEKADVRALFNHDANYVLGRTTSGTLALREDETGLMTECDPPDSPTIRDLVLAPIARGDVTGMSIGFSVRSGEKTVTTESDDGTTVIDDGGQRITLRRDGDRLIEEREVLAADLYDVSPVTFPAFDGTDVALRSRALFDDPDALQKRIAEMDRPHRRPAPRRDEARRWLDSFAASAR